MTKANDVRELSDVELETVAGGANLIWEIIKLVGGNAVWDGIKGEVSGDGFVGTMAGKAKGKA